MPSVARRFILFPAAFAALAVSVLPALAFTVMGVSGIESYTIQLYSTSLNGSQITHAREIIAQRSDGSRAEIHERPVSDSGGEWVARKTISFANGMVVDIRTDTKAKTTITHDPNGHEWINQRLDAIDPASDCTRNFHAKPWAASMVVEGHEVVKGYDAVRVRFSEPNGDVVTEWRSPAFGCDVLQEDRVMRNGTVEHKIPILLQLGEPEPFYFEVPADYKELGSAASTAARPPSHRRPRSS